MPLFFLSLEPGSDTYMHLYQETLYRSESCRRKLRKTAPCESPGMATQVRQACRRATGVFSSPAGPHYSCPLHLFHLSNLSFMIGMPNRCCILKLRATNVVYATSLVSLSTKAKLRRRKPNVLVALAEIS